MHTSPLSKKERRFLHSLRKNAHHSKIAFNPEQEESLSWILSCVVTSASGIGLDLLTLLCTRGWQRLDLNMVRNEGYWERLNSRVIKQLVELERKSWFISEWLLSKELWAYMTENYAYLKYAITKCQPDIKLLYRCIASLSSLVIICVPGALLSLIL